MDMILEKDKKPEAEVVADILSNLGNTDKREMLIFAEGMRAANILNREGKPYADDKQV
ncbi:MAG: hypothetical protein IJ706_08300 [Clostridia bacterium]|nr:hypothetical protein [Clostridia bacterium]